MGVLAFSLKGVVDCNNTFFPPSLSELQSCTVNVVSAELIFFSFLDKKCIRKDIFHRSEEIVWYSKVLFADHTCCCLCWDP